MTDINPDTVLTARGYLRSQGLDNDAIAEMLPEFEQKVRDLFVQRYGHEPATAAVTELDDYRDEPIPAGESLPIILGGGTVFRCYRCSRSFTAETYRCVEWIRTEAYLDVCRRCADADPHLHHWQAYCDVADMIDALMKTAPDGPARRLLSGMVVRAAEHFEIWRWPDEQPEEGAV